MKVLYSFPHKLGADRICHTAWQQVNGLLAAGADVLLFPGALHRRPPCGAKAFPTLARGGFRIPCKLLGTRRACALHDFIVARRLREIAGSIDIVHAWPLGSRRTLKVAREFGIPAVLERPNAHTRFAYEVVQNECRSLGLSLPAHHEHAWKKEILRIEEEEYDLASGLLCPSDFVSRTFQDRGFAAEKLLRHQYGFDEKQYFASEERRASQGLRAIFAGGCAPRKGLHYALRAWLESPACTTGTFLIAGAFVPGYAEKLAPLLGHSSVMVLGHRTDLPALMRGCDALILPSVEEGSALVTYEARGSGCVLLVSEAAGAVCEHMRTGLVHRVGDVQALKEHIALLHNNRGLLERLRAASLNTVHEITWMAAGVKLLRVYRDARQTATRDS